MDDRELDAKAARRIIHALSGAQEWSHSTLVSAAHTAYAAAGRPPPRVVIAASPMAMAFAAGFAAAIWWTRKNQGLASSQGLAWPVAPAAQEAELQAHLDVPGRSSWLTTKKAARQATIQAVGPDRGDAAFQTLGKACKPAPGWGLDPSQPSAWLVWFASLACELGAAFGVDHRLMKLCGHSCWALRPPGRLAWPRDPCCGSGFQAFRELLGLYLPEDDKYLKWNPFSMGGVFLIVHDEFCMLTDQAGYKKRKLNVMGQLHCADGPSCRWRDGWGLYHWNGVHVPWTEHYIISSPERITVAGIDDEPNVELRRLMIERYGLARYVGASRAYVVDELPAGHMIVGLRTARLLCHYVWGPRDAPVFVVDLLNSTPEPDGTVKRYLLRIDPDAYRGDASRCVHAAVASTWRNEDGSLAFPDWRDYRPDAES